MNRNTYILLGIVLVLVFVAFLVMQKPGEQSSTGTSGEFLASVDSLSVDKIEIKSPNSNVVLERRGVEWYLQHPISCRADQANVASLIQQSKNLEIKSVVSSKPEKQSVFQVDSTGTLVKIYEKGAEKSSFVIGKGGASYSETYARRSNSNDVVLVGNAMSYVFNRPVKEWRDRTIFITPKENIKEITFQFGDTTFVLMFKDSLWLIGSDSTQQWVVDNLLSSLSNFQADEFVDTPPTPAPKINAMVSSGGVQLSFSYVKEGDKYYVRSSTSPQWYEVQSWRANQVLKRKKEILKSGT
ncbi:MAG TPA: hypothetical protein DCP63_03195 [Bacteroidetes bacterium]|nr:hypothetical protein [Bacteroidota bacterium]